MKGFTAQFRQAAKKLGDFDLGAVAAEMNVKTYADRDRVRQTIHMLRKTGEVVSVTRGQYRYQDKNITPVKHRVYRAMHVKGVFSVREIMVLTDADRSYIAAVIRLLMGDGIIESQGKKPGPHGRSENVFRLKSRDKFYLDFVRA